MSYKAPKFFIGEWYRPGELMERCADEKHNVFIGFETGGTAQLKIHDYFVKALSLNMGVAVQITDESLAYVKGAAPENVVAWILPDEPIGKVDVITLGKLVASAVAVNPLIPIILNLDGNGLDNTLPVVISSYIAVLPENGIVSIDFYPINFGRGPAGIPFWAHLVGLVRGCGAKSVMAIVEAGNIDVSEQDWIQDPNFAATKAAMRGPTTNEITETVQLLVDDIHPPVDHIAYFPDDIGQGWKGFTDVTPEASAVIAEINQELSIYRNGGTWPLPEKSV